MNKKLVKGLTAVVPIAAMALSFIADRLVDKERDEKYVSREELHELLKNKEES